jgi:FAD-dependent fumarate reductase
MVSESSGAIEWLKEDIGAKLDVVTQLGGHSTERTHRSDGIPPGFEIISKLK